MTLWFSSDHHFMHRNIITLCNRPFSTIKEMDEELTKRWNSKVQPNDVVYYLGDFTLGKPEDASRYFSQLNGNVYFISGNHDKWLKKTRSLPFTKNGWVQQLENCYDLKYNGHHFVLCHYPILDWNKKYSGSIHLYGHTHGNLVHPEKNAFEVSVDVTNFYPISIDSVIERVSNAD